MVRTRRHTGIATLPRELPIFPLPGVLLLPRGYLPLNIFEPRYLAMIDAALATDRLIGMIQPTDPEAANPSLFGVGCAGRITAFSETDDQRYLITLTGVCRFRIGDELDLQSGYRRVVPDWSDFGQDFDPAEPPPIDRKRLEKALKAYFRQQGIDANWDAIAATGDDKLVTSLAMICPFQANEKQALLEAASVETRAELLMALVEMAVLDPGDPARH